MTLSRRSVRFLTMFVVAMLCVIRPAIYAESANDRPTEAAAAGARKADLDAALKAADKAVARDPKSSEAYSIRAKVHEEMKDLDGALKDLDKVIELRPDDPQSYQRRAVLEFRMAEPAKAVKDFDKVGELRPASRPYDWQRGIALYYAGRFEDGAKQFELHRTVNADDVENAAWHFLCVARFAGVDKARARLIPIAQDDRIPMMKIHELFAGKATPDDVIAEAKRGEPAAEQLKDRLFYAHLYIGLYFEATGNVVKAEEHLQKAASDFKEDHYMGMVAQVHVKLLNAGKSKEK